VVKRRKINEIERTRVRSPPRATSFLKKEKENLPLKEQWALFSPNRRSLLPVFFCWAERNERWSRDTSRDARKIWREKFGAKKDDLADGQGDQIWRNFAYLVVIFFG
jgi:hypothetical protein